jgi:hypothetical protein
MLSDCAIHVFIFILFFLISFPFVTVVFDNGFPSVLPKILQLVSHRVLNLKSVKNFKLAKQNHQLDFNYFWLANFKFLTDFKFKTQ